METEATVTLPHIFFFSNFAKQSTRDANIAQFVILSVYSSLAGSIANIISQNVKVYSHEKYYFGHKQR